MDSLAYKTTPKEIILALKDLERESQTLNDDKKSRALDYAYIQAMGRINGQTEEYQRLATQVLSWITCAKRPLLASELQHALAVEIGEHSLDKDNITPVEIMISVCAGLVIVDEQSEIIRLVHHTAQEYFQRTQDSWFPNAQTDITKRCITYLSFDNFETDFCLANDEFKAMLKSNVLYGYAAGNWGDHARMCSAEDVNLMILDFLENENKVFACSRAMMVPESYVNHIQRCPKRAKGLHLAAYFGLVEFMAVLLKGKHDANTKDTYDRTPLLLAAANGHQAAVKLLVDKGADLESKDEEYGRAPLSWATENGHQAVLRLLVDEGADLESKDYWFRQTTLSWAAEKGNEAVVKLLLGKGANPESKDEQGWTPLSLAAGNKHEAVAELLLGDGADVDSKDENGRTPLSWAAESGHMGLVKLLLDNSADVESKDYYGQTSLSWAVESGHMEVVKLLLDNGADVDSKDENGRTPLSWFAGSGHMGLVKLLLDNSADVESKDDYGQTSLFWAVESGHMEVVKLLLDNGADVERMSTFRCHCRCLRRRGMRKC
jgi:ankyrin repeat protein